MLTSLLALLLPAADAVTLAVVAVVLWLIRAAQALAIVAVIDASAAWRRMWGSR